MSTQSRCKELMIQALHSTVLCRIIIYLGCFLRTYAFISNRSLSGDEARFANELNFGGLSFLSLIQKVHYPIGFVFVEKSSIQTFINNEYFLRLWPFVCGIVSLFLFYTVAKKYLIKWTVPFAVFLFSLSPQLINYSIEAKPYMSDVVVTLLLLIMCAHIQEKEMTVSRGIFYSAIGACAIYFSYPAVFVLAGIGCAFFVISFYKKQWRKMAQLVPIGLMWIISFISTYVVSLRFIEKLNYLVNYWDWHFVPLPFKTFADIKIFSDLLVSFFSDPLGIYFHGLGIALFLIGCIAMYVRRKRILLIVLSPVPFVLIAYSLHKYPFSGRLLLFLVPLALLIIANGFYFIVTLLSRNRFQIGIIIGGLLILPSLITTSQQVVNKYRAWEVREVMAVLDEHIREGDYICLYHWANAPFQYYIKRYNAIQKQEKNIHCIMPSYDDWNQYWYRLSLLRGKKRVWMVFCGVYSQSGVDEEMLMLYYLDILGKRVGSMKTIGASLYLYDLSLNKSDEEAA
ncbi:MAG: glycosyltransferase family 39 protein [Candidatus Omnitrophica bacterium]|nr:glycosyltransferase family 39 protein [Candidatus Omnitrophota bacterium]